MDEGPKTKELEKKNLDIIDNKAPGPLKSVKRRVKIIGKDILKIDKKKIFRFDNTVDYLEEFELLTDAASGKTIGWDFPSMIKGGESAIYSEDEIIEIVEKYIELPENAKFNEISGQTLSGNKVLCGSWIHYFNKKLIENDSIFIRFNPTTKKIISARKYWYEE
jgi:hypothetical protein